MINNKKLAACFGNYLRHRGSIVEYLALGYTRTNTPIRERSNVLRQAMSNESVPPKKVLGRPIGMTENKPRLKPS
jgi:hypothetical protein